MANRILIPVGLLFLASSLALLIYYIRDTAGAGSLTDRLLQALLASAGAYGLWLASAARRNLAGSPSPGAMHSKAGAASAAS